MRSLLALVVSGSVSFALAACADDGGEERLGTAQGLTTIDGELTLVEVVVAVPPGEDAEAVGLAALAAIDPAITPLDAGFRHGFTGLVWDQGSAVVNYNPAGEKLPQQVTLAARASWTDLASSAFEFVDGGTTTRCPSLVAECKGPQVYDGFNDISWISIKDPTTLGVTWSGTSRDEMDMALDSDRNWYGGADPAGIGAGQYDAPTVWLHEFGHALGLGHSDVPGAVMEPFYGGPRRALFADDAVGATALYPESCSIDADCGTLACVITTCDAGSCVAALDPACGGGGSSSSSSSSSGGPTCEQPPSCSTNGDCCPGTACRGKPGARTCR